MIRTCIAALLGIVVWAGSAAAQCTVPNTLTNGTNADATQVMANFSAILTCINSLPPPTAAATSSSPRQTVSAGPVTTAGLPNFLPATAGSLSVTTQNVSAAAPLAVTAANNVDATTGAQKDLIGKTTSNLTWSSLAANSTHYLYVTVATNGTLTAGATTQAPVYQWGGTPATTNGLFTFNIGEMRGYLGNGSTAPQAYVVFLGEAVTSASVVTSTVAYAYNGAYDSGFTNTLPGATVSISRNHNLGLKPLSTKFVVECITAEQGYAIGDQIVEGHTSATATFGVPLPINSTAKTVGLVMGSNTGYWLSARAGSPGTMVPATVANWKYKFVVQRGW